MRMKPAGKILIMILVLGVAIGAYRLYSSATKSGPGGTGNVSVAGDQGILGRPLRVGVVTWPGYAGGIVANNGFRPNKQCIYWNNHKLLVEFVLMEDVDARAKAFARGGPDGVDIVWSTVDFWANELPGFIKGGTKARAIMQVDWSRGGDAIVADKSIQRIEDLKGKKVSLALFTPSHWLLEYSLENSSLDETAQNEIVKNIIGKNASPDARADFVSGKVDAAVVWEPDVAEALRKRPNSHILVSSETAANLIADLMVANEDFIAKHPDVIKAFIQGWLDGVEEANRRPSEAARLLMENESVYKDLGDEATRQQLPKVKWADLADNTKMFGLDGSDPLFDRIFRQASLAWVKRGYITQPVAPAVAKDDHFLRELYTSVPKDVRVAAPKEEFKFSKQAPSDKQTARPVATRPVNIYFAAGSSALDPNGKQVLDTVALTAQTYSNAYLRVEGNTDNVGNAQQNVVLSRKRAQAVVNYLVNRYGLASGRFVATGNGPNKPIASNDTDTGRTRNRRTDVLIVPR